MAAPTIRITIDYDPVKRHVNINHPPDLVLTYGLLGYAQGVLSQQMGRSAIEVPKLVDPTVLKRP